MPSAIKCFWKNWRHKKCLWYFLTFIIRWTYSFNFSPSSSVDPPKSVLKVNVPAELEGIAFIQVVIQKESEQLVSANICQSGTFDPSLVNIFFFYSAIFCLLKSVNLVIFPFRLFFTTFHNFIPDKTVSNACLFFICR